MPSDGLLLSEMQLAESQNVSLGDFRSSSSWSADLSQSQMFQRADVTHVSLARVRGFVILLTHHDTSEPRLSSAYYILSDKGQRGTRVSPSDGMGWISRDMTQEDTSALSRVVGICDEILARTVKPIGPGDGSLPVSKGPSRAPTYTFRCN